jgi:hypothetical protein
MEVYTVKKEKKTKVTYKKDRVNIEMSRTHYHDLLKGYNDLNSALGMLFECQDMYLSDMQNLETLKYRLIQGLGFVEGEHGHYSNAITTEELKTIKAA